MILRKALAILLLALLAAFVGMNLDHARIWLFGIRAEMPVSVLVLIAGLLGLGAGYLLAYVRKSGKAA